MLAFLAFALTVTACLPARAQAVAVFTQFTPTVIRMTIGASVCTAWSQLPAPWPLIIYCTSPTGYAMLPASVSQTTTWDWRSADGAFTWQIQPSKMLGAPALDWQIVGTPTGGTETMKAGTF